MQTCFVMLVCVLVLMLSYVSVPKPVLTPVPQTQCHRPERTVKDLEPRTQTDSFPSPNRLKRSQKQRGFLRGRRKPNRAEREKDKGRACGLRHVQLKVSDLGLGYRSQEELIFSYCSGVCVNSLTNYDKILRSLGRDVLRSAPSTACCRPLQFDDRLSFLDDHLVYHTMDRHSARKCGCV